MFNVCLSLIPLSLLVIIFQTSPFWISILGYFVNYEPIVGIEVIGMVVCFIGVVVITLSQNSHATEETIDSGINLRILGIGMIFTCAWLNAITCVLNRKLSGVHHAVVMFWHAILGFAVATLYICIESYVTGNKLRFFEYTVK